MKILRERKMKKMLIFIVILYFQNCITLIGHQIIRYDSKNLPEKEITCGPNFFQVSFPKTEKLSNYYSYFYFSDILAGAIYSFATYWPVASKTYLSIFAYGSLPLLYTAIFVGFGEAFYNAKAIRYSSLDFGDWAGSMKQNCQEGEDYFYFSIVNERFSSLKEMRFSQKRNPESQLRQKYPQEIFLEKILQSSEALRAISVTPKMEEFFHKEFASVKKEFCNTVHDNSYCLYSYHFPGGVNKLEKILLGLKKD